jgi:hypothetical protein
MAQVVTTWYLPVRGWPGGWEFPPSEFESHPAEAARVRQIRSKEYDFMANCLS